MKTPREILERLCQERVVHHTRNIDQALKDLDILIPSVDEILYTLEHTIYEKIDGFIKTAHAERLRRRLAQAIYDLIINKQKGE